MSRIERLTRTHADLEAELTQFARLLDAADTNAGSDSSLEALREEIEAVQKYLERHIASERSLEERSDFVLGEGSMEDYGVTAHHTRMRAAVQRLSESMHENPDGADLNHLFAALIAQFERYTAAELEFLRENGAILYPGGSSG